MSREKSRSQPRRSLSKLAMACVVCLAAAAPAAHAQTVVNGMAFTVQDWPDFVSASATDWIS